MSNTLLRRRMLQRAQESQCCAASELQRNRGALPIQLGPHVELHHARILHNNVSRSDVFLVRTAQPCDLLVHARLQPMSLSHSHALLFLSACAMASSSGHAESPTVCPRTISFSEHSVVSNRVEDARGTRLPASIDPQRTGRGGGWQLVPSFTFALRWQLLCCSLSKSRALECGGCWMDGVSDVSSTLR